MGMTVNGNVTIHHYVEAGATVNYNGTVHQHGTEATVKEEPIEIPEALSQPKAQALLKKAQDANWLDGNFQPTCSKTMAAIIASEIAEKLKLYPKWKPFEELWGEQKLSRIYSTAMDQSQTNKRIEEIRKALK